MAEAGPLLEWAVAERPAPGEPESGDAAVVVPFPGGLLAAAIDALGHGPEAAAASRAAIELIRADAGEPVDRLMARCHQRLRRTRGVVMSLAAFDARAGTMTWVGVGNVEGKLLRASANGGSDSLVLRGGIVGLHLPALRPAELSIGTGDLLVMATDGIRADFGMNVDPAAAPEAIAGRLLREHGKESDDALVIVGRYVGGGAG